MKCIISVAVNEVSVTLHIYPLYAVNFSHLSDRFAKPGSSWCPLIGEEYTKGVAVVSSLEVLSQWGEAAVLFPCICHRPPYLPVCVCVLGDTYIYIYYFLKQPVQIPYQICDRRLCCFCPVTLSARQFSRKFHSKSTSVGGVLHQPHTTFSVRVVKSLTLDHQEAS